MSLTALNYPVVDNGGTREQYAAIARAVLNQSDMSSLFEDWLTNYNAYGWGNSGSNGTAAVVTSGTVQGGIERVGITGGATNDYMFTFPAMGAGLNAGKPVFYAASRTAHKYGTLAANAVSLSGVSMVDANNSINTHGIGIAGSGSLTNFCIQRLSSGARTYTNMGVAIDSAPHLFEIWGDGTNIYGRIDGGAIVTAGAYDAFGGVAYGPVRALALGGAAIGTVTANLSDWVYFACARTAF